MHGKPTIDEITEASEVKLVHLMMLNMKQFVKLKIENVIKEKKGKSLVEKICCEHEHQLMKLRKQQEERKLFLSKIHGFVSFD